MKPLYVIDFSNFAYKYKAVHKYAKKDIQGVPVDLSVLVGFIKSLKQNMFDDIMIALDGKPQQSLNLIPGYKGQRTKETLDTIGVTKLETIQFLTKIGQKLNKNVSVVYSPLQEADQVIASTAIKIAGKLPFKAALIDKLNTFPLEDDPYLQYLSKDITKSEKINLDSYDSVVVGTTDSDMKALCIYDNVAIDTSTSGKKVRNNDTAKAVAEVNPFAIPIYKAIYGDTSDNVPGYKLPRELIQVLNRTITSQELADKFVNFILTGMNLAFIPEWIDFLKIRDIDNAKQFKINYDVVKLSFMSIPFSISYPNYRIETTIEKFGLRI